MSISGSVREVKEAYERIAEVFSKSRGKPWLWVFNRLPNGTYDTVLDAGCGNGANTRYAVSTIRHRLYIACDVSFNMVKGLQRELGNMIDTVNCDVRLLPLRSSTIDLYLSIAVLHHLNEGDREAAYAEAKRVLKRGGLLLATVWGCAGRGCDKYVKWTWGLKEPVNRFYHLFTMDELRSELSRHLLVNIVEEVNVGRNVNYLALAVKGSDA